MTRITLAINFFLLFSFILYGERSSLTKLQIKIDGDNRQIRPCESIVLYVIAHGKIERAGKKKTSKMSGDGVQFSLPSKNSGWLSKPFRFQGRHTESFAQSTISSTSSEESHDEFGQDSVLYTAPEQPGQYWIKARLKDQEATIKIRVNAAAPSLRKPETTSFPVEPRSMNPYRKLAEHHSPFVAQETWFQPKSDYVTRFDFDGDWQGDNNWDSTPTGTSQAYLYYAVMETRSHWFLVYSIFHPRDYYDICIAGTCHENDSEGLILTVAKDGSQYGYLQSMETLSHNNIYSYLSDKNVEGNIHGIDGKVEFYQSHPVIFIESGGHGIYGSTDKHSNYDFKRDRFLASTGVTYIYKGKAQRPRYPNQRLVGYELLSTWEHLWALGRDTRHARSKTYADYFSYQPYGNRPTPLHSQIPGAFLGRKMGVNKAKPFWGWKDQHTDRNKILAAGQWGLDPAYAGSRNLKFPPPFSLEYVFNPFLGIGGDLATEVGHPLSLEKAPISAVPRLFHGKFASTLRARPSQNYDSRAHKGQFDLRLRIDQEVNVEVQGTTIRYELIQGRRPSDAGSEYSQEIPRATLKQFKVDKKDGRGKVIVLENPSTHNGYSFRLRFLDPKGGDDRYHVQIRWQQQRLLP